MLKAITTLPVLKDSVIEHIASRKVLPAIAADVLQLELALSEAQTSLLLLLFEDSDPKWRRVCVELLRRVYLSAEQITEYGSKLLEDDQDEIRRATKRRLAIAIAPLIPTFSP